MPIRLEIAEVGSRGDGIAVRDGQRFFVPGTLPGESVAAEPGERRGEGVVAELTEILAPSPHRVAPPCAHFGPCGGCSLQHWRSDAYGRWKVGLIERSLAQRGVVPPPFESLVAAAPGDRRRVDFVLRRNGRRVLAGFHERASTRVVDVGTCVIARPALNGLLAALRAAALDLLPDGAAVDALAGETDSGIDLLLRPHRRLDLGVAGRERLALLAEQADLGRVSWGGRSAAEPVATRRPPFLTYGDVRVEPPPGVFLQASQRAELAMRAAVAAWTSGSRSLADLFAGIGALSLGAAASLALFESDRASVAAVEAGVRRSAAKRVAASVRDLFRNPLTGGELGRFDAVLLDPPRAGAAAQCAVLGGSQVPRIVYASCDPGSFARDARQLQDGGYRLEKLLPIDQFVWSPHVELIALFVRAPLRSPAS